MGNCTRSFQFKFWIFETEISIWLVKSSLSQFFICITINPIEVFVLFLFPAWNCTDGFFDSITLLANLGKLIQRNYMMNLLWKLVWLIPRKKAIWTLENKKIQKFAVLKFIQYVNIIYSKDIFWVYATLFTHICPNATKKIATIFRLQKW